MRPPMITYQLGASEHAYKDGEDVEMKCNTNIGSNAVLVQWLLLLLIIIIIYSAAAAAGDITPVDVCCMYNSPFVIFAARSASVMRLVYRIIALFNSAALCNLGRPDFQAHRIS